MKGKRQFEESRGEACVCPLPHISTSKVKEEQGIPKEHAVVGSCGVNESALSNAWGFLPSKIQSYIKLKKKKRQLASGRTDEA